MIGMLFESFAVPSLSISSQAVNALYASGRTTGCVLDLGYETSNVAPVFEGYVLPHSVERIDLSGKDVTAYLRRLLKERGYDFTTDAEWDITRNIKESFGFVSNDYRSDCSSVSRDAHPFEREYMLPDGSPLTISKERFQCAEIFFQPQLFGAKNSANVPQSVCGTIETCTDIRKELYGNIVLCGGSSMFRGLEARVLKEVRRTSTDHPVNVVSQRERKYTTWIGGSVLASLSTFPGMQVTKAAYEEHGASVVHRKCL